MNAKTSSSSGGASPALIITTQQVQELQEEERNLDSQLSGVRRRLAVIRELLDERGEGGLEEFHLPPETIPGGIQEDLEFQAPRPIRHPEDGVDTLTALIPRAIEAKPGSTPAEIKAWVLRHVRDQRMRKRVESPYFYKAVHRLAKSGAIRKDGTGYWLGRVGSD